MSATGPRLRVGLIAIPVIALAAVAIWMLLPPGALSFAGGQSVSLSSYAGPSPTGAPEELRSSDLISRGKYLTQAADCQMCHTRAGGQPFAGGLAFETPFGVLYSPNITADVETGIGAWTDADFLRAVHDGVARNGERLYPAFPYESYTLLSDEDVLAIKAYLFSLPVAHAAPPANRLSFPFNQRWLMAVWAALYSPNQRFRPHPDHSPEWNRGAYLAEALAHCGDCHTPRNLAEALNNRRKFGGTTITGWRAYNITPDPVAGIGAWSDAELAAYLNSGHAAGHGSAGGPMSEEIAVSSSSLTASDLHAVVIYLRSIPPIHTRDLPEANRNPAADSPKLTRASVDLHGKQIFEEACTGCHGWSGRGVLTTYATLTGGRAVNDPSADNVVQIVLSGARVHAAEGIVLMPAFGRAYSDAEIAAVANYVTARFGASPSHVSAQKVAQLRHLSSQ